MNECARSPAYDVALVGGGLANGLIALALIARDPKRRFVLIERASTLGGNHTWCFHCRDVPEQARAFFDPLVEHRWSGYDVHFPSFSRTIDAPYGCVSSARFDGVVRAAVESAPNATLITGVGVRHLDTHDVVLDDGRTLSADLVVDGRGPERDDWPKTGYQKFFGLEVELERPHALRRPLLMDATVPQRGGYRFFYVLPFSATRLLVEDTIFSHSADLDLDRARQTVLAFADERGFRVRRVLREEHASLPMPYQGEPAAQTSGPLRSGYRGGWFHPATGYSLPVALRLALLVSDLPKNRVFGPELRSFYKAHLSQFRYATFLNRMLFQWFEPEQMWNVFERFNRLPSPVMGRFYAMELTAADRARIMLGRPPRGMSLGGIRNAFRAFSHREVPP